MIVTINNKLLELLTTLTWPNQPFTAVYDYHNIEHTGNPYASFELVEFEGEYADTCNNNRDYTYEILVFQEITESGGRQEAVDIIYKCFDDIIALLDNNYTLDGVATRWAVPLSWTMIPFNTQNWPTMVWELRIVVKTFENVL